MKITESTQLGIQFHLNETIRKNTEKIHNDSVLSNIKDAQHRIHNLISPDGNKNYYFSRKAKAIADKIKIDDKLEPSFFHSLPVGKKATFLMGRTFYKFHVLYDSIMILRANITLTNEGEMFTYTCYSIYTDNRSQYNNPDNFVAPLKDENFALFLKMLIFLEFSEVEFKELGFNQKAGDKRNGKVLNSSNQNVVFVDSNWNVTTYKTGLFSVSGHFRLQPVGEGRKLIKLIYIKPFAKSKIKRIATKLNQN